MSPATSFDKPRVAREAQAAAAQGSTLNEACPYPFNTTAGLHFAAHFIVAQWAARKAAPPHQPKRP